MAHIEPGNPFSEYKVESPSAGFEVRRQELSPQVRSYIDTLYVQIRQIFDKYGVANIEDLRDGVKEKRIKMEMKDGDKLKNLTRWLRDTLKEREIPKDARKEDLEWFVLEDIPTFTELPSEAVLKDRINGFKFDRVYLHEFYARRPLADFKLTAVDLDQNGIKDHRKITELLDVMASCKDGIDSPPIAKVIEIGELMSQARQSETNRLSDDSYITNNRIFEALDEAGYRPATFEELLAFARDHWKAGDDANRRDICTLGSMFTDKSEGRSIPCIGWHEYERSLSFSHESGMRDYIERLLVVRR